MTEIVRETARFTGDRAAAATSQGLADRGTLALISVERTRMPMVISDPRQADNPIVLANGAFLSLTGYDADEVVGHNCRFLQGPGTDRHVVSEMRRALVAEEEMTVELLNYRKDGSTFWNELHISPIHDDDGHLLYYFASQMDVTDRKQAHALEQVEHRLLKEVDHRAKNALALVQGIVRLSRADNADAYARAVQGRVDSLARAHGLLAARGWQDVSLTDIVLAEMEPFGRQRIAIEGPPVAIAAAQVQPLALVLHELLSNAAQHGALSTPDGHVAIRWMLSGEDGVDIDWRESGGPPIAYDPEHGFGLRMASGIVRSQMRGRLMLNGGPDGLHAALSTRRRISLRDDAAPGGMPGTAMEPPAATDFVAP